jgi:hypothetical protein
MGDLLYNKVELEKADMLFTAALRLYNKNPGPLNEEGIKLIKRISQIRLEKRIFDGLEAQTLPRGMTAKKMILDIRGRANSQNVLKTLARGLEANSKLYAGQPAGTQREVEEGLEKLLNMRRGPKGTTPDTTVLGLEEDDDDAGENENEDLSILKKQPNGPKKLTKKAARAAAAQRLLEEENSRATLERLSAAANRSRHLMGEERRHQEEEMEREEEEQLLRNAVNSYPGVNTANINVPTNVPEEIQWIWDRNTANKGGRRRTSSRKTRRHVAKRRSKAFSRRRL